MSIWSTSTKVGTPRFIQLFVIGDGPRIFRSDAITNVLPLQGSDLNKGSRVVFDKGSYVEVRETIPHFAEMLNAPYVNWNDNE